MAMPAPLDLVDAAAFAAILGALARPGTIHDLPEPGEGAVLAALLDRECRVHAAPALQDAVARTGARLVPLERCDHAVLGGEAPAWDAIPIGSQLHPEGGATVILRARLAGPRLRLTGPGVDGAREVRCDLAPGLIASRTRAPYPLGFDLLMIDGLRLMGLTRSTTLEVL